MNAPYISIYCQILGATFSLPFIHEVMINQHFLKAFQILLRLLFLPHLIGLLLKFITFCCNGTEQLNKLLQYVLVIWINWATIGGTPKITKNRVNGGNLGKTLFASNLVWHVQEIKSGSGSFEWAMGLLTHVNLARKISRNSALLKQTCTCSHKTRPLLFQICFKLMIENDATKLQ